tara:strand:+ start:153 stop:788 length:636 start_codon:yes stop_codon:yes gene_type:complete
MSYKKYLQRSERCLPADPSTLTRKQRSDQKTHKIRRQNNRAYVLHEIEKRGACEFCGLVDDPKVYQWHHIDDEDPTKKKISDLIASSNIPKLTEEFKKVVMLCPTCHHKFHQDLCCMLDHKQRHLDGTFYEDALSKGNREFLVITEPTYNHITQEWEDGKVEFLGDEGEECYNMLLDISEHRGTSPGDTFWDLIREGIESERSISQTSGVS